MSHATFVEETNVGGMTPMISCEECHQKEAMYQCPRCARKTCSLTCCRAHKLREKCNGKRDKTKFLSLSQMNDSALVSDYFFLEDITGNLDSGKRLLRQVGGSVVPTSIVGARCGKRPRRESENEIFDTNTTRISVEEPIHTLLQVACTSPSEKRILPIQHDQYQSIPQRHQLPPKLRTLQRLAAERLTTVLFMPFGMARHQSNQSYVKRDVLYWTVEWCLHWNDNDEKSEKKQICMTQTSETSILGEVLQSLLSSSSVKSCTSPTSREHLQDVYILLKKLPAPSNQPKYKEIPHCLTLKEALQHATIYEHPTLDIVPAGSINDFPRLISQVVIEDSMGEKAHI